MTTCHTGDEGRARARNRAESRAEEEGENWSCCAAARGIFQGSKWSRTPFQLLSSPPPVSHPLHAKHGARETKGNTGSGGGGGREESSSGTKKSELTASTLFFDLFIFCLCIRFNAALAPLALLALGAIPAHHCFFRSRRGGRWPVAKRDRPRLSPSVRLRHHDSPTQRPNYLHLMIYPLNWCLATFVCAQMEKRLRRQTGKWQRFGK